MAGAKRGGAGGPRGRSVSRGPRRDAEGSLLVEFTAAMASGAHQEGEEAQYVVYQVARALDAAGSGRVSAMDVARELRTVYRGGKIARVLGHAKGERYWLCTGTSLVLHSQVAIVESFEDELPQATGGVTFALRSLDTRPRRDAALLAAVVACVDEPRSRAFVERFTRVDRKTVAEWMKDEVIRSQILRKLPEWAARAR